MTLGEKLRSLRLERNYKLTEVQHHTGITESYLSKLERDIKNNPSLDVLRKLANFYQIDINWLMLEENSPPTESTKRIKEEIIELLELIDETELKKVLGILKVFVLAGGGDSNEDT